MSAGYGFFNIAFVKMDNSPDAEAAQRALAWAKENLDLYKNLDEDSDPFELNGNCWETNYDNWGSGVDVKDTVPCDLDWLEDVCDAVQAEKAVGTLTDDFSESDADANGHLVYQYEDGGVEELQEIHFNSMCDPMRENDERYVISSDSYREYKAAFKNKESGEVVLCGECHYDDEDEKQYVCFDDDVCYSCDVYADKIFDRYSGDEDDDGGSEKLRLAAAEGWEFVGFMTQPAFDAVALGKETEYREDNSGKVCCEKQADEATGDSGEEAPKDFEITGGELKKYTGSDEDVSIPGSVRKIGEGAFYHCANLASVIIPEGVTAIGEIAFERCTSLTSVNIPTGVTEIGESAFDGCKSLASVTIPASVSKIGNWTFEHCTSLRSVSIPDSVTEIGQGTFSDCTSLTSAVIPASVTEIDFRAFEDCTSLASISLPESVTEIGKWAFKECTALAEIHFAGSKEQWEAVKQGNDWRLHIPAESVQCTDGTVELPQFDIEDGTLKKYLGTAASISIPEGVTEIEYNAFSDCTSLASVSIPASVTEIGSSPFEGYTSIAEIRYAGTKAQWEAVKKGDGWYKDVPSEGIRCEDGTAELPQFDVADGTLRKYLGTEASVTIPEGVTKIQYNAFDGCTSLTSINIPEDVTEIGRSAFSGCTSLASLVIPASVKHIDDLAFKGCTSLASVNIPEGVTKIGKWAFEGCTSLAAVSIPASVTKIGEEAFKGCTSLAEIHFAGSKEQWYAVQKGEDWNKDVPATDVLVRKA